LIDDTLRLEPDVEIEPDYVCPTRNVQAEGKRPEP
jgi:hypothetical protein